MVQLLYLILQNNKGRELRVGTHYFIQRKQIQFTTQHCFGPAAYFVIGGAFEISKLKTPVADRIVIGLVVTALVGDSDTCQLSLSFVRRSSKSPI